MSDERTIRVEDVVVEHAVRDSVVRALDIPSLVVPGGSSAAVMGPSGCGKSTLLGVLAGLAVPTRGSVRLGDAEVSRRSAAERIELRRRRVGMVYQADNLLPFLTVAENAHLQLSITGTEIDGRGDRVADVLDRLGIGALAGRLPDQLSGGQRQRAAVARAIVHEPEVILADEPTGALDAASAAAVVQLLMDAHARLGATLVVVTHDPEVASTLERIVTLRDGIVVEDHEARRAG